jgi:hypothetical protein
VLGDALPLGACPHEHSCIWTALTETGQRYRPPPLGSDDGYWELQRKMRQAVDAIVFGPRNEPSTTAGDGVEKGEVDVPEASSAPPPPYSSKPTDD